MTDFEFTDRYGGNHPDPATMCPGDCEGMGCYPVEGEATDLTAHEQAEVNRIKIEQGISVDGWYFVRCPDCNGTGKRPTEATA